jgi:hypothetical protein
MPYPQREQDVTELYLKGMGCIVSITDVDFSCRILGSHVGEYENDCLLGCSAM